MAPRGMMEQPQGQPRWNARILWRWLTQPQVSMGLAACAILFAGLGRGDLRIDAPLYAWIAKYIALSGDWLNLYYDHGQTPYFNKPPLQFWLMALVFKGFGASTFTAKLVSALFGLGCVGMVYALARLAFDPAMAATAGVAIASTSVFIRNSRGARLDAGVTFFFLVMLYVGARMMTRPGQRIGDWALLGAAGGLALMIKSGVALMCLPILWAAWAWHRRWDLCLGWRGAVSLAVCAAVLLPWHLHQYITWGQPYINEHFRHQLLGRFEAETFGASVWYAFFKEMAMRYWPWLPLAIYGGWTLARSDTAGGPVRKLFISWLIISLSILHLISRKYDRYLLLVFPVMGILAAYGFSRLGFWRWWTRYALPNLGWAAILIGLYFTACVPMYMIKYPELAQATQNINAAQGNTVYTFGSVGISAQCAIRFYTNARVVTLKPVGIGSLRPGDIIVWPRDIPGALRQKVPHCEILAEGGLIFGRVRAQRGEAATPRMHTDGQAPATNPGPAGGWLSFLWRR